ncbi:hypothetical protein ES702_02878 [subsurface metagenome]
MCVTNYQKEVGMYYIHQEMQEVLMQLFIVKMQNELTLSKLKL